MTIGFKFAVNVFLPVVLSAAAAVAVVVAAS